MVTRIREMIYDGDTGYYDEYMGCLSKLNMMVMTGLCEHLLQW